MVVGRVCGKTCRATSRQANPNRNKHILGVLAVPQKNDHLLPVCSLQMCPAGMVAAAAKLRRGAQGRVGRRLMMEILRKEQLHGSNRNGAFDVQHNMHCSLHLCCGNGSACVLQVLVKVDDWFMAATY